MSRKDNKVKIGFVYSITSDDVNETSYNSGFDTQFKEFPVNRYDLDFHKIVKDFDEYYKEHSATESEQQASRKIAFKRFVQNIVIQEKLDGIILPGNYYDMVGKNVNKNTDRVDFEDTLIDVARDLGLPILAVCSGMQHLAYKTGAKMTQDADATTQGSHKHDLHKIAHDIHITPHTALAGSAIWQKRIDKKNGHHMQETIDGHYTAQANSFHSQAALNSDNNIAALANQDLMVSATDTSGKIIEGIENTTGTLILGTQSHPEYLVESDAPNQNPQFMRNIITTFIEAAQTREKHNKVNIELSSLFADKVIEQKERGNIVVRV